MDINDWINNPKTIKKSKKTYSHFDYRIDIRKAAEFIGNPQNIARYGFYPFIHYTMEMDRYNSKTGKDVKKREICYAAHMDRCIYQYYAYILNESYNKKIMEYGIEKVPVAYRTDLKDNNIQSAKKAFDFIKNNLNSYVMIGDFTHFFDNLDHKYLKKQWCKMLQVDKLPNDHYAVYKNITKYSKWELEDLLNLNGLDSTKSDVKKLNKMPIVLSKKQYKLNRKHIIKNEESYGIPQGSPISAVLANIYMFDTDKIIYDKVNKINGFYMRYSDDFIIILPKENIDYKKEFCEIIEIIRNVPNLKLENKKTQFFSVNLNCVSNISKLVAEDANVSQKNINFLGFSFDGNKVYIRRKTIGKYYYRMNRKAKSIAKNERFIGADKLYKKYSIRGSTSKHGNFFTYVNNAQKEFGYDEMLYHDLRRHMSKIRKALKKNSCL